MNKRIQFKRIIAEVTEDIHKEIKTQAAWRNMTIRKYILQAVLEKISREKKFQ